MFNRWINHIMHPFKAVRERDDLISALEGERQSNECAEGVIQNMEDTQYEMDGELQEKDRRIEHLEGLIEDYADDLTKAERELEQERDEGRTGSLAETAHVWYVRCREAEERKCSHPVT